MARILVILALLALCIATASATTVILVPGEDLGNEYIFNEPSGYANSRVNLTYSPVMKNFNAHISAKGLKPGFTYQVKLIGTPNCAGGDHTANENIGYSGRWYCPLCSGDSEAKNRIDAQYQACKSNPLCTECIHGYIIFDHFVANADGSFDGNVTSNRSYHVFRCGTFDSKLYNVDKTMPPFSDNALKCEQPELCHVADVIWDVERVGFSELPQGNYKKVKIALTEESFHQPCGEWANVLTSDYVEFKISRREEQPCSIMIDEVNIGDTGSETGHNLTGWSNVNGNWSPGKTSYGGGPEDQTFRLLMGSGDGCGESFRDAYLTLDAGNNKACAVEFNHLDGSQPDNFNVSVWHGGKWQYIGNYTQKTSTEDWLKSRYSLPGEMSGVIKVKLVLTSPQMGWCLGWGQTGFSWAKLYAYQAGFGPIPEFRAIAAFMAIAGALASFLVLRKR